MTVRGTRCIRNRFSKDPGLTPHGLGHSGLAAGLVCGSVVGRHERRGASRQCCTGEVRIRSPTSAPHLNDLKDVQSMLRNLILWFAGVPIFVIILLNVFGFLS